jgi:hypothetical protein
MDRGWHIAHAGFDGTIGPRVGIYGHALGAIRSRMGEHIVFAACFIQFCEFYRE